jgi:hypothetical protein
VPVPQFRQLIVLKVAFPKGHCKQVAEPLAEIAPLGQLTHEEIKTENWFGLAVSGGHRAHVGLMIEAHNAVK